MANQLPPMWTGSSNAAVFTYEAAYRKHYSRTGRIADFDDWRGKPSKYCESFYRLFGTTQKSDVKLAIVGYVRHACRIYFLSPSQTEKKYLAQAHLRRRRLQRGWEKVIVRRIH
jgi:hypothetical protein